MKYAAIILSFLLSCSGGGGSGEVSGNTSVYYIDPSASSNGNGSLSSPYNTFYGISFEAGAEYLIKRGTVLYEEIVINSSGSPGAPVVIGAYGTGADPVVDGSEIVPAASWADEGAGVYSNTLAASAGEGRGNVTVDSVLQQFVETATPGIGEYTIDNTGKIQIYGNPSGKTVSLSRRYYGIKGYGVSNIVIRGIHIRRASLHGIQFEDSHYIEVTDCIIEMCGGAFIGALQAGNGIEFGNSSSHCTASGCTVTDIFDSGISPQTYDNSQAASDFIISGNTISQCGFAGIEVAVLSNGGTTGSSIANVTVTGNTVSGCGSGFSGIRYGNEGRGIKIAADDGAGTMSGISVEQSAIHSNRTGIFLSGNIGTVDIRRSRVYSNTAYGIATYDVQSSSSLKLLLSSSLVYSNSSIGLGFHVLNGNGFEIYHNTFYNNEVYGVQVSAHNGSAVIRNNIFYSAAVITQIHSVALSGVDIDYNCYRTDNSSTFLNYDSTAYSDLTAWDDTGSDTNSISSDPLFGNSSAGNFSISDSSSCYHMGLSGTGITEDFEGNSFNPSSPSIGAFEY